MKKYFLFIAGFVLLFNSSIVAQIKFDTAIVNLHPGSPRFSNKYSELLWHNMTANKADAWQFSGGPLGRNDIETNLFPKFDVWVKQKAVDKEYPSFSYHYNRGSVYGSLVNTTELELATTSITKENAGNYKYHIVNFGGEELVPWQSPSDFKSNKFTSYAYLGKFNLKHETLILTIVETINKRRRAAVYVYNSDDYRTALIKSIKSVYSSTTIQENPSSAFRILTDKDPKNIILELEDMGDNNLYYVYLKRKYKGKVDTIPVGNGWETTNGKPNPTMHINSSLYEKPGTYTILIQPEMQFVAEVPRTIIGTDWWMHFYVPEGPKFLRLRTVGIIILSILTIAGVIFFIYQAGQNRKLAREEHDKQIATLQLQSVRAQLNPHFIFNALAGIQNLMNKNEVENANKYLARFARLTRNVLDDGQKELTSIEHEVKLLADYLEMEQMRFGFKFDINVGEGVDQQIEIPAMLLQPFVENAVKHGISTLKGEGLIAVKIAPANNDITLSVADNGNGFTDNQTPGMGIKLCEERIKLLNGVYKNSTILLHINSTPIGTIIGIELKNWL